MSYIVTYKGNHFNFTNPTPEMIDLKDIFRALPRLNRFVGHSKRAYSVGEHTFLCLVMAELLGFTHREQLLVFVHDFTEAYVGDCPAPLKRLLPEFAEIEAKVEDVIYKAIGIEPPTEEEYQKIKGIDLTMLAIEMRDLTEHEYESFIGDYTYVEMLNEEELKLANTGVVSERLLVELLEECFNNLLQKVKEEEVNA